MKKVFIFLLIVLLVGCTKKADIVCTSSTELYTTTVELYFNDNILENAYNFSTYKDKSLAEQVCTTLGDKVRCYENNVEIVSFYENNKGLSKYTIVNNLEQQGFTCK